MKTTYSIALSIIILFSFSCKDNLDRDLNDNFAVIKTKSVRSETKSLDLKNKDESYQVTESMLRQYLKLYETSTATSITPYTCDSDTLFYLVDFGDYWQVISADTRTLPIIAEGNSESKFEFDNKDEIDIAGEYKAAMMYFKETTTKKTGSFSENWVSIRRMVDLRLSLKENSRRIVTKADEGDFTPCWMRVLTAVSTSYQDSLNIPHLIETKWGQEYPWNNKMPLRWNPFTCQYVHAPSGCVAVAISQVLFYFHNEIGSPTGLYENVYWNSSDNTVYLRDFNSDSDRWDSMMINSNDSTNISEYVTDLMLTVGKQVNMTYYYWGSGATVSASNLSNAGLDSQTNAYDFSTVLTNLQNDLPVIVEGRLPNDFGHCWIIDGYLHRIRHSSATYQYFYIESEEEMQIILNSMQYIEVEGIYSQEEVNSLHPGVLNGTIEFTTSTQNYKYLRMNWGYDGENDDNLYGIYSSSDWDGYNTSRQIYYNLDSNE